MRIQIKILCNLFLILLFLLIFPLTISADMLGPGEKQITGYVKFEGWESVEDYVIVEPIYAEWGCYPQSTVQSFYLVNDGNIESLGYGSHSSESVHPVAISRKYLSDIKLDKPFHDTVSYVIDCNSDGYKNANIGDRKLPNLFKYDTDGNTLEGDSVSESDPTIRKDFIVTFEGIDPKSKTLKLSLSAPIIRTNATQKEAEAFVQSLTQKIILSNISAYITQAELSPTIGVTKRFISPTLQPDNQIQNPKVTWSVFSYASVGLLGAIVGFYIGRKFAVKS